MAREGLMDDCGWDFDDIECPEEPNNEICNHCSWWKDCYCEQMEELKND